MNPTTITTIGRPIGFWKSIVLDFFAILFAGLFGFLFAGYLNGVTSLWFVLGVLLLWSSVSVLQAFLQQRKARRFLVAILESLAVIPFFFDDAWQALAITSLAILVFLLWGYFAMRRQVRNSIEIRFFATSSKVVGKVITAAVIAMIILYASFTNNHGSFFVSESGFDAFFAWSASFVNNFYPTLPLNGSFGNFAQAVARMQLESNPTFKNMTPADQSSTIAAAAAQVMTAFSPSSSTNSGTSLSSNEPASNAFYDYFVSAMNKLQDRFSNLFIGAWGLALFLILRSIGIIVVWVGQFVALLFYELCLATGFMRIREETQTKEVVEFT